MPAPAPAEIIPIPDYLPVDQKYRLEGLRQIYNLAKSILSKEANGAPGSEVDELRAQLNEAYNRYVLGFGPINSKANSSLLKTNPAFPFLRALEVRKGDFDVEKAPIFSRSTVRPRWQRARGCFGVRRPVRLPGYYRQSGYGTHRSSGEDARREGQSGLSGDNNLAAFSVFATHPARIRSRKVNSRPPNSGWSFMPSV